MKIFKNILLWFFGVIFTLGGISTISTSILPGILIMIGGISMLPPIKSAIREKFPNIKTSLYVTVVALLILIGIFTSSSSSTKNKVEETNASNNIEQTQNKDEQIKESENSKNDSAEKKENTEPKVAEEVAKKVEPVEEYPQISAQALHDEYESNEVRAKSKYATKKYEITGVVNNIAETFGSTYVVITDGGEWTFTGVQCFFKDKAEIEKLTNLEKGQTITVIGEIDGYAMNVTVRNCKLK